MPPRLYSWPYETLHFIFPQREGVSEPLRLAQHVLEPLILGLRRAQVGQPNRRLEQDDIDDGELVAIHAAEVVAPEREIQAHGLGVREEAASASTLPQLVEDIVADLYPGALGELLRCDVAAGFEEGTLPPPGACPAQEEGIRVFGCRGRRGRETCEGTGGFGYMWGVAKHGFELSGWM